MLIRGYYIAVKWNNYVKRMSWTYSLMEKASHKEYKRYVSSPVKSKDIKLKYIIYRCWEIRIIF